MISLGRRSHDLTGGGQMISLVKEVHMITITVGGLNGSTFHYEGRIHF